MASKEDHLDVVTVLLEHGVNVWVKHESDWATPLHCASFRAHLEVVQLLLQSRDQALAGHSVADVDAKTKHGNTTLSLAIRNGHGGVTGSTG
ncbi:ankyrin repeat-containing domain protein [Triangularia setosa]|uniref:Ankyrin repeat-containing domain protein n=1 Tax=Triangularia setosa TaxID=2587417 RepID=A0AAN6W6Q6_9PEZI|nr:ankyrin repeat-containing domain protein [Podospora setosa]